MTEQNERPAREWLSKGTGAFLIAVLVIAWVIYALTKDGSGDTQPAADTTAVARAAPAPQLEEFQFNANEEVLTVLVGLGTYHKVWANKPFLGLAREPDGSQKSYRFSSGWSSIKGRPPEGPARLKGLEDGTVVRFQQIR